jgi:ArsR family transcriptional regulator
MNINQLSPEDKLTRILRAVSTPARLRILAAIGDGEACVCHLEAYLDLRQAYISQQLMEMREAGLVETRREGRYIFYRLIEPQLLDLLIDIGRLFAIPTGEMESLRNSEPSPQCCCPDCLEQLKSSVVSSEEISSPK